MARRGKYNRRRARGRFSFLYKLLSFIVICGVIAVALTLFFKVQHQEVTGNSRYTGDEIVAAGGLENGANLFLLNKYDISARITASLPYVETVQIRRALPDTLIFTVTECTAPAAIMQEGSVWLLSGSGKVLEKVPLAQAKAYAQITGITLVEPTPGVRAAVAEDTDSTMATLLELLAQMQAKKMLGDMQEIHLEDASQVTLRYLDRFNVIIPRNADFDYKLEYLLAVVKKLEVNEVGTIDMTQEGRASFIPE